MRNDSKSPPPIIETGAGFNGRKKDAENGL
jgi:hypothetical protein